MRHESRAMLLRKGIKTPNLSTGWQIHIKEITVDSIVINRSVSSESTEIREHIVQFYNRLNFELFSW